MEEEWKLFRKTKYKNYYLFSYYISNYGRVKLITDLGEEILEVGKGLAFYTSDSKGTELTIIGIGSKIYHLVWDNFMYKRPKYYQIHHKDFNHFNNRLDNLECLTTKEHGLRHKGVYDLLAKEEPLKLSKYYNEYVRIWKEHIHYIKSRLDDIWKERVHNNKQQLKELRQQKKLQQLEERNNKLKSGEYYLNENGRLCKKNNPKWTEERRKKTMETRKEIYSSEEWINNVREGTRKVIDDEWRLKVSIKTKEGMTDKVKEKIRNSMLNNWNDENFRRERIKAMNKNNKNKTKQK